MILLSKESESMLRFFFSQLIDLLSFFGFFFFVVVVAVVDFMAFNWYTVCLMPNSL